MGTRVDFLQSVRLQVTFNYLLDPSISMSST